MTEFKSCKRCGNENYGMIYTCEACGAVYCDSCGDFACPKDYEKASWRRGHNNREIGYIAGFCDICHESMFGYKRFFIGEFSELSGHQSCLEEFLETGEGVEWSDNENKLKLKKAEEEKRLKEEEEKNKKEKERIKQERLAKLTKLRSNLDPFSHSNPLYDVMEDKIEYYSRNIDETGNEYWVIYVTPENAEIIINEQKKLEVAKENEQRKIRKQANKKRFLKMFKRLFLIILGLVIMFFILKNFI
jgi:hypothetical protein